MGERVASDSVHDNYVYAYTVDCEGHRVTLHTEYRDREPHMFTDVVFRQVVAHFLEHSLPQNILFDVEEGDLEMFLKDNADLFATSWKWAWPPIEFGGDPIRLLHVLRTSATRVFFISSSLGLSGWVLSASCHRVSRDQRIRLE